MDKHAVNQTLVDLQQPVEMTVVRREMGGREEPGGEPGAGEEKEEEEEQEELKAKKSFRYFRGSEVPPLP